MNMRALLAAIVATALAVLAGCGEDSPDSADRPERERAAERSETGRAMMAADRPDPHIVGAAPARPGAPVVGEPSGEILATVQEPVEAMREEMRSGCADADQVVTRGNLRRLQASVLCLLNAERTSRGLRPLRSNARLARAATAHSRDMVAKRYFSHDSRDGRTATDRVRRSGYIRAGRGFVTGENIAWGSGFLGTPGSIVEAWMKSPGHRANILTADYRDIGIGIASGVPVRGSAGSGGGTYTTNFGALR